MQPYLHFDNGTIYAIQGLSESLGIGTDTPSTRKSPHLHPTRTQTPLHPRKGVCVFHF